MHSKLSSKTLQFINMFYLILVKYFYKVKFNSHTEIDIRLAAIALIKIIRVVPRGTNPALSNELWYRIVHSKLKDYFWFLYILHYVNKHILEIIKRHIFKLKYQSGS